MDMVILLFGVLEAASFLESVAVAAPVVIVKVSLARRPWLGKTLLPVSGTRGRLRRPVLSP
jgi:hypothetical protein